MAAQTALNETRPGIRTTEFWLVVFYNVVATVEVVADPFHIPNKWVALGWAIVNGAYAIARGQAKNGVPAER